MITKYKLYENMIKEKPKKTDDDFNYLWIVWAKNVLNNEFGAGKVGSSANHGGYLIWQLESKDDYFIIYISDNEEIIFMLSDSDDEESWTEDLFTASLNHDNLEELLICVGDELPIYKDKFKKYKISKTKNEFNI